MWGGLWGTPQAAQWERLGWTRVVARYAHLLEITEQTKASALIFGEVRQLEDRLGLSPMAMLRLRWEIDEDDHVADVAPIKSKSPRLRVVAEEYGKA